MHGLGIFHSLRNSLSDDGGRRYCRYGPYGLLTEDLPREPLGHPDELTQVNAISHGTARLFGEVQRNRDSKKTGSQELTGRHAAKLLGVPIPLGWSLCCAIRFFLVFPSVPRLSSSPIFPILHNVFS
jgi:hypothetical protein